MSDYEINYYCTTYGVQSVPMFVVRRSRIVSVCGLCCSWSCFPYRDWQPLIL